MKNIKDQQGWTMWSMAFVMAVLFSLAYVGMNLVPMFSQNASIEAAIRGSLEGKNLRTMKRRPLEGEIKKRLYVDSNHELLNYKEELVIKRDKKKFTVEANYSREIPLAGNLLLVARFNPKVECDLSGRCDP